MKIYNILNLFDIDVEPSTGKFTSRRFKKGQGFLIKRVTIFVFLQNIQFEIIIIDGVITAIFIIFNIFLRKFSPLLKFDSI